MEQAYRIAIQSIYAADAFWVQAGVFIEQYARQQNVNLITLDIGIDELDEANYLRVVEDLQTQEIQAFIIQDLPAGLIKLLIEHNIPVISLNEQPACNNETCSHTGFSAPLGLAHVAEIMTRYLAGRLGYRGHLLVVGGLARSAVNDDGRSRLARIKTMVEAYPGLRLTHIPSRWPYEEAYPQIFEAMKKLPEPADAIFGLSDTLALAARAAATSLNILTPQTLIAGLNAEPKAVAAIIEGEMTATVEISVRDFGQQVVDLARKAATEEPLPLHFNYRPCLVTQENAAEVAANNLVTVADLPNLLLGVNRRQEQQRMTQLETSLAINRQIGTILDPHQLNQTIVNLIRSNYNFDRVQLYLWSAAEKALVLDDGGTNLEAPARIQPEDGGVVGSVFVSREMTFVPDMRNSQRFLPDRAWPDVRSRVVLPVQLGENILGILDLQCDTSKHFSMEQLLGLQLLADQLAIAISNARLYNEALEARRAAEKSDKLKTLLLANVSHEFRTPLNIILGYTQALMRRGKGDKSLTPPQQEKDLQHIYSSGEHLVHLVNDLLDLSRAEIDELEIYPEVMDVRPILEEVLQNMADVTRRSGTVRGVINWRLEVPPWLPLLHADPVRLRQILLNLLSNAYKFTGEGEITLGAEVELPHLHFWVKDNGSGVPPDQQERIFEPFVIGENTLPQSSGIGLGLSITRRLVLLHGGSITVESKPDQGSTFHVYLPLPVLNGAGLTLPPGTRQTLIFISNRNMVPPEIKSLAANGKADFYRLKPSEVRTRLLSLNPTILIWDAGSATRADWTVIDYLRANPHLARLSLVLYGENSGEVGGPGFTNILQKPFTGKTLEALLETVRPAQSEGAVLIVDDDNRTLKLYEEIVAAALPDWAIYRANNGREALALLETLVPALVIIDLVMPEVDGFGVIDWLRANPSTCKIPILVVSGQTLTAESLKRLDYQRVIFNSKEILNQAEASEILKTVSKNTAVLPQHSSLLVKKAIAYLQQNYTEPLSLQEIASEYGISKNYLGEIFHQEVGISPWEYLNRFRINQAKRLLNTTDLSIRLIAGEVGFDDPSYFSRVFRALTGQTPKTYRDAASGTKKNET